jgi:hypothetical protein
MAVAAAALPSTLPAVASTLMAQLAATPALTATDVNWGGPTQSAPDEVIAFSCANVEITSATIGQQKRDEQYDLIITISVNQNDVNGFNPLTRAETLRDAIASLVRADATIGGALNLYAVDQGYDIRDGGDGNWSGSELIMRIHCRARI